MSVHHQEEERRKYQIPKSKPHIRLMVGPKMMKYTKKRFISNVLIMNVNNQTTVNIDLLNVYNHMAIWLQPICTNAKVFVIPVLHVWSCVGGLVNDGPHAVFSRLFQVLKTARAPEPPTQGLERSTTCLTHFLPSRRRGDSPSPLPWSSGSALPPCSPFVHHSRDLGLDRGKSFRAGLPQLMEPALGTSSFSCCRRVLPDHLGCARQFGRCTKGKERLYLGVSKVPTKLSCKGSNISVKTCWDSLRAASCSSSYCLTMKSF